MTSFDLRALDELTMSMAVPVALAGAESAEEGELTSVDPLQPDTLRPWSIEERKYIYASSLEGGKRAVMARRDRTLETAQYGD